MQLFVKVVPMKAASAEPAGNTETFECPSDVEPDTILSFLTQKFGDLIDTAWTYTDRHPLIEVGWIFGGTGSTPPEEPVELLCVPQIRAADGHLHSMFELLADQREDFMRLATSGHLDSHTVIERPQREYHPQNGILSEYPGGAADGARCTWFWRFCGTDGMYRQSPRRHQKHNQKQLQMTLPARTPSRPFAVFRQRS
jgi:hypothetical protein